jgi:hypothetical protein
MSLSNPEGIGRAGAKVVDYAKDRFISPDLKERKANVYMTLGCLGASALSACCVAVGLKLSYDALNARPVDPTPTKPAIAPTFDNRVHFVTSTPPPTEINKPTVYRMEIKRGDTIWELVQAIESQYPAGGSYVYYNSRTGDQTELLSREKVLTIHSVVPGDMLYYILP